MRPRLIPSWRRNRANERFARSGRAPGGVRKDRLRNQYGLRKTRIDAHLAGTSAATAGESGAIARKRCRRTAERTGNARDDAAARQRAGERIERRAAAVGRDTLPDAERQGASDDSLAGLGG